MRACIIGASAGLGRAIAEQIAGRAEHLYLVASDQSDLDAMAADLSIRHAVTVHTAALDLRNCDPNALYADVVAKMEEIDTLFLVAGFSSKDDNGAVADSLANTILTVNFTGPVRIANAFLDRLAGVAGANIVVCGSVATARPRRGNALYASAKKGLEFYAQAIRHTFANINSPCKVQVYHLGYLKTRMTFGQKLLFPAAEPDNVAKIIISNLGKDIPGLCIPKWWTVITTVFKLVPWAIFKKMNI